jgi:miniconductance mechanosensitive channel
VSSIICDKLTHPAKIGSSTRKGNTFMLDHLYQGIAWLKGYPEAYTASLGVALLLVAGFSTWILKVICINGIYGLFSKTPLVQTFKQLPTQVITNILHVIPAMIIMYGVPNIPGLPKTFSTVVENVSSAFIVMTIGFAVCGVLDMINTAYQTRTRATQRTIKGYIQIAKIVIYCLTGILCIAAMIDKSPLILFSGLGAIAAVAMFIFQSTITSFVANLMISTTEVIRLGDWIEVPQYNANGDVIDIALSFISIKNFDATISTIPIRHFVDGSSFKNYRGMRESGSRRIMRSIFIDQNTIGFLSSQDKAALSRFTLLRDYLSAKDKEITEWNKHLADAGMDEVNTRRITNIGTFRAYLEHYLKSHHGINQSMTLMVRQLDPTPTGLPLQLYCWCNTTVWTDYERIMSDIFDHVIAILPEFGLSVHQSPSGVDIRALKGDLPAELGLSHVRSA